jgi:hypothetical protein
MRLFILRSLLVAWSLTFSPAPACAAEEWTAAFAKMPVATNAFQVHLTPPVELIFNSFKPTPAIRGVILMPAAADQIYFFDWGRVSLPPNPSLFDTLQAFTNRAKLSARFVAPFLLIAAKGDYLDDPLIVGNTGSMQRLEKVKFPGQTRYVDRPYDRVLVDIKRKVGLKFDPNERSPHSWHYYRLAFIGFDLTGSELLRAIAMGTKTTVRIEKSNAIFQARPPQL